MVTRQPRTSVAGMINSEEVIGPDQECNVFLLSDGHRQQHR